MSDDPRNDQQYLDQLGPQLAIMARQGYTAQGRGAVLIDMVTPAPAGQVHIAYVPKRYLRDRLGKSKKVDDQKMLRDIERYDPKRAFIVLIQRPDRLYPYKMTAYDEASGEQLELGPVGDVGGTVALCIRLLEETGQDARHIAVMRGIQEALERAALPQARVQGPTIPSA